MHVHYKEIFKRQNDVTFEPVPSEIKQAKKVIKIRSTKDRVFMQHVGSLKLNGVADVCSQHLLL